MAQIITNSHTLLNRNDQCTLREISQWRQTEIVRSMNFQVKRMINHKPWLISYANAVVTIGHRQGFTTCGNWGLITDQGPPYLCEHTHPSMGIAPTLQQQQLPACLYNDDEH